MDTLEFDPTPLLARELDLAPARVSAAIRLFAGGATVPFIARYRKEATSGLDEVQLRAISERREYLVDLEKRRQSVLNTIDGQGELTDELRKRLMDATTKSDLEDLYLPFKPKKKTRATQARERGLQGLADRVLTQPTDADPVAEAQPFVDLEKGVSDPKQALDGARDIIAEQIAETAVVRAEMRRRLFESGFLTSKASPRKEAGKATKFDGYVAHRERLAKIPSHRYLAIRRGENGGYLSVAVELAEPMNGWILNLLGHVDGSPFGEQLAMAVDDAHKRLLMPAVGNDIRGALKTRADLAAVEVFASNLKSLLLAPALGPKTVLGIDPGLRTGCKCTVIDPVGKLVAHRTIQPWKDEAQRDRARADLMELAREHRPVAIAVGNGTAGRETEAFARDTLLAAAGDDAEAREAIPLVVPVNESGASVYSASELAGEELPDVDVTIRGSASIARRLQDPLAELVKIDPKSIGVGQYQHDVHKGLLKRKLGDVVESCVNHVGVEVNTASASLLGFVSGVGPKLAKKIVEHREKSGRFRTREQLHEVPGLGGRTYEQAAGFLRITDGDNPLDASAVHPERYELVEKMASDLAVSVAEMVGNPELVKRVAPESYVSSDVGMPTLTDILKELERPGRDPRESFEPPRFRDDVKQMTDLRQGMVLEGVVTNVTAFGAFVDIGVHQDGLVHVSELADRFISNPIEAVHVGQRLQVKVMSIDLEGKRIGLSARTGSDRRKRSPAGGKGKRLSGRKPDAGRSRQPDARSSGDADRRPRRKGGARAKDGANTRLKGNGRGRAPAREPRERSKQRPESDQGRTSAGGIFRNNPFEVLKKR